MNHKCGPPPPRTTQIQRVQLWTPRDETRQCVGCTCEGKRHCSVFYLGVILLHGQRVQVHSCCDIMVPHVVSLLPFNCLFTQPAVLHSHSRSKDINRFSLATAGVSAWMPAGPTIAPAPSSTTTSKSQGTTQHVSVEGALGAVEHAAWHLSGSKQPSESTWPMWEPASVLLRCQCWLQSPRTLTVNGCLCVC